MRQALPVGWSGMCDGTNLFNVILRLLALVVHQVVWYRIQLLDGRQAGGDACWAGYQESFARPG